MYAYKNLIHNPPILLSSGQILDSRWHKLKTSHTILNYLLGVAVLLLFSYLWSILTPFERADLSYSSITVICLLLIAFVCRHFLIVICQWLLLTQSKTKEIKGVSRNILLCSLFTPILLLSILPLFGDRSKGS